MISHMGVSHQRVGRGGPWFPQPARSFRVTEPIRYSAQRSGSVGVGDRCSLEPPMGASMVQTAQTVQHLSQGPSRSHPNWHLLGTRDQGLYR